MQSSTVYKISKVILILGIIGSIICGFVFKTVELSDTYLGVAEHTNWVLMISGIVSSALLYCIMKILASILEGVEKIHWAFFEQKNKQQSKDMSEQIKDNISKYCK